jgi:predicted amidophosphoribosyltransferase
VCGTTAAAREAEAVAAATSRAASLAGELAICGSCGAIAASQRERCACCGHSLAHRALAPAPREDAGYWARITAEFQCRGCGAWSPLDGPDTSGTVECTRCELLQAYDVGVWADGLAHAHEVADLAGPGRDLLTDDHNPHASIGRERAHSRLERSGMLTDGGVLRTRSLRLDAGPGHPLCARCKQIVRWRATGDDSLETTCPACGDAASYTWPRELVRHAPQLVGVLAAEFRTDRPDAKVEAGGGVVALSCPRCSAPLEVKPSGRFTTCAYCKTTSRIASKAFTKLLHEGRVAEPWWILVRGPSAARAQRLRELTRAEEAARPVIELEAAPKLEVPAPLRFAYAIIVPLAALAAAAWIVAAMTG